MPLSAIIKANGRDSPAPALPDSWKTCYALAWRNNDQSQVADINLKTLFLNAFLCGFLTSAVLNQ